MKDAAGIFRFLIDASWRGERTALITIIAVERTSSRAPGTHMAVSETGRFHGSFSGGCVEAAVVAEALRVLATGEAEVLRFGAGSRFIDIRLPCGGAVEFLVTPDPPLAVIDEALTRIAEAREPVCLALGLDGSISLGQPSEVESDTFLVRHDPDLRLVIIGHGAEAIALARLGLAYGAEVLALSPDADLVVQVAAMGGQTKLLLTPARSPHLSIDPRTAVVLLFHDHDWEDELLAQALEGDAFFVGAMGSRLTHHRRLDALRARGLPEATIARVVGPIGMIPAARDPDTLALSAMAQIAASLPEAAGLTATMTPRTRIRLSA